MLTIDKLPNVSPMIRFLHTVSTNDLVWNVEFLPFRERSFLTFRLRGLTYTEIGKKFKVSAERARQIVRDATKKLLQEDRFTEIDGKLHFRGPHNVWRWGRTSDEIKSTEAATHSYFIRSEILLT
ncbi:hypothetical protein H8E77_16715 [bacterium]|nr:hypothetical protein [bacterium]